MGLCHCMCRLRQGMQGAFTGIKPESTVNGTGKTTTIGKLATLFREQGKRVLVGAADTFRAAAVEQLAVWVERAGADMVRQHEGADPAAVAFDTVQRGAARAYDVVIVDTAGRVQTDRGLMDELAK